MGYTHYYNTEHWNDRDVLGWEDAIPVIQKILQKYKDRIQFESDDTRRAVVDKHLIRFNGIGENGHETFYIENKAEQNDFGTNPGFGFCKTARKPYDIAVCEVLLVLKAYCPHLHLNSDGFVGYLEDQKKKLTLDGVWDKAIENVKEYGIVCHPEIVGTHGGKNGKPDPYCSFEIVFDDS